jgi:hypothetical protein
MINNPEDFGYDYTIALCEAIDKYLQKEEAENPAVFIYKGSNLRYALSRALYFGYINDNDLFEVFRKYRLNIPIGEIKVKNQTEKKLLSELCNGSIKAVQEKPISKSIKKVCRQSLGFIIKISGIVNTVRASRQFINARNQNGLKPKILFSVINERFVRYVEPITGRMATPLAFLTYNNEVVSYLKQNKKPFVPISKFGYFLERLSVKDGALRDFGVTDKYDLLFDTIERISPKSAVIIEGNTPQDEVVNQICKKLKIESICIQQGWATIIHTGFRNMSYSKMLVWGEGFGKLMEPFNPEQKFVATGNHNISVSDSNSERDTVSRITIFPQGMSSIISRQIWDNLLLLTKELALNYPQCEVRIREHPNHPVNLYSQTDEARLKKAGVIFMSPGQYTLDEVLRSSDLSVSIYSTTILESIAAGVLPIIMNETSFPQYYPDVDKAGAGIETKSLEETKKVIGDFISGQRKISDFRTKMEEFKKLYFKADKKEAIQNIVKEIEN